MEIIQEPLNEESIQKLLEFLPYFLENNIFEKEDDSGRVKGLLEYPEYVHEIKLFMKTIYDIKFLVNFKWMHWDEGREILYDFDKILKSDLLTLRMLMTSILRSERFVPGIFLETLEYGVVTQILLRLEKLSNINMTKKHI